MKLFTYSFKAILVSAVIFLSVGDANAQQILDDFNRSSSNTVGTPTLGAPAWTEVQTNSSSGNTSCNISGNNLRMYSVSSSSGKDYVYRDCSGNYPTVLSSSQYQLVWQFKTWMDRTDPSGFASGNYGSALILGSTSSSFSSAGNGYAVVHGQSGSTDPIRLVRFTGGIATDANLTNLISYGDYDDDDYLAIKVVYTPSTNLWELFIDSDDNRADFGDVDYPSAIFRGSAIDATYTGQDLKFVGALYNHGTTNDEQRVDEIYIPLIPSFYYSKATGDLNLTTSWGTNLDGSGTNPPNFTTASAFYNIRNGTTHTLGAAWTVSGSNSKVILGDSTNTIEFVVPPSFNFTGSIDVSSYSKLVLQYNVGSPAPVPSIGAIAFPSTVEYASTATQVIQPAVYWDLICSSTGGRNWSAGFTGVMDTFVVGVNAFDNGTSNAVFDFMGAQTQYVPAIKYRSMLNSGNGDRVLQPSGIIEIRSEFTPSIGLYTVTGSTVQFSNTSDYTVPALYVSSGPNYHNVICSGGQDHVLESPMTIGGNLTILQGDFFQNTGTTIFPLTINGDLILNGGDYIFSTGTGANILTLKGNLTQIGTSSNTEVSGSVLGRITFAGNGNVQNISANDSVRFESCIFKVANGAYVRLAQNLSLHRNTTSSLRGTMEVLSGGTLDCSTFRITAGIGGSGSAIFTLNSDATLVTGNVGGVAASVIASNLITTYNNSANYKFNANAAQVTSLVNTNMKDLAIDNTAHVTLNATISTSGNINFTNGRFNTTGAFRIIQGANGIVTGAGPGKYVNGTLEKFIASSSTGRSFEIGDNNYFTPIDLVLPGTTNGTGSLTATTTSTDFPSLAGSGINPSKSVNRYWTLTNNGVTGFAPYNATFGFKNPNDMDAGTDTANFVVVRNSSGTWYATGAGLKTSFSTQGTNIMDFSSFQIGETFGPPVVTCPNDTVVDVLSGCSRQVNYTATVSGNPPPSFIYSITPNSTFNVGTTPVTVTATNISGTTSCTFNVTVNDIFPPVLTGCPSDIVAFAATGECDTIITWTPPFASDNCSTTVSNNYNPGDLFPVGVTTVTYTASDSTGNSANCSFTVTVIDNQDPVITGCPGDTTVHTNGSCGRAVSWIEPTADDNCTYTFGSNISPNAFFPVGTTLVTYTATDSSGNSVACSFNVTVVDTEDPEIICPPDTSIYTSGACDTAVSYTLPTMSDNCTYSFVSNYDPGDLFSVGINTVTYTITDSSGNQETCSFNVIVINQYEYSATSCGSYTLPWGPVVTASGLYSHVYTSSGGCDSLVKADITILNTPSSSFPVAQCDSVILPWGTTVYSTGAYNHIYTAANGCDSTVTANVTINSSQTHSYNESACDSLELPWGLVVYTSGVYDHHYLTIAGCDSLVTANVTINYSSSATANVTICAGQSYTPPGGTSQSSSGTYTSVIFNAAGCDSVITTILTVLTPINVTATPGSITCNGGSTSVTVSATGGTGIYVSGTGAFSNQLAGSHTYIVTDDFGCSDSTTIIISEPAALAMGTCSSTDATCFGISNGTVTAGAISNAVGTLVYTWNNSSNVSVGSTASVSGLPQGTYTLTVSDDCFSRICSVTVGQPAQLSMTACTHTDVSCFSGSNGSVTAGTVSGAVGTLVYTWRDGNNTIVSNSAVATGLTAGLYFLSVSDNCSLITCSQLVVQPGPLTLGTCTKTDVTCNGGNDGTVQTGNIINSVGTVNYEWKDSSNNTVSTSAGANGLVAGTYTLTVTDSCSSTTCSVTISQPGPLTMGLCSKQNTTCNGGSNGSVSAGALSNVVGSVTYTWKDSLNQVVGSTATVNSLPAGSYTLTVEDDCSMLTCTVTIGQPALLSMAACTYTDVTCNGGTDGTVQAGAVSGNIGPVLYVWKNSSNVLVGNTAQVTGLPQDVYTLTVSDNCSSLTCTVTVSQPNALFMDPCTHTDVTCFNGSDGSVSAGAVGGNVGTIQYTWRNSSAAVVGTSASVTGLPQGTYTLTVTDNCSFVTCTQTVSQPNALSMSACSHTDVTCNNGSDGSVTAGSVSNSVGTVTYTWRNAGNNIVGSTSTVSGLPQGTYTLTVTDNCGSVFCTETINQPGALTMSACSHTDVTCNNGDDGTLTAGTVSNSVGTVYYNWKNASNITIGTIPSISGVGPGVYTLTVTDSCSSVTCTLTVGEPAALAMSGCTSTDVTCHNGSDGSVSAGTVSNSVGTIIYEWKNSSNTVVGNTASVSGLPQGTYTLTVSDACSTLTCSVSVNQPVPLSMTACSHTNVSCFGGSNGTLSAGTVSGAVGALIYVWKNSSNNVVGSTAQVTNLPQGVYTLSVWDNCDTLTCSETISQPNALSMAPCSHTDVTCNGGSDGSVSAGALSNSIGAVAYTWKNAGNSVVGSTSTVTGLPQGTYTLTVTDSCGFVTCSQTISQPNALSMLPCTSTNATCNNGSNGTVTAGTVSNNVGAVSYSWNNSSNQPVGNTSIVTGLPAGTYTLTVSDNCSSVYCSATVGQPGPLSMTACTVSNVTCNGGNNGTVTAGNITNSVGSLSYTWKDNSNNTIGSLPLVSGLAAGTYTLTVTDNCSSVSCTVNVTQPGILQMSACSHTDVTCNGGSDGTVTAGLVTNAVGTVNYTWNNSSNSVVGNSAIVSGLPAGTYTLTVTDACSTLTCSQTIGQPTTLAIGACSHTDVTCNGGNNGTVTAGVVTGNVGAVTYTWKDSTNTTVGTSAFVSGLPAGAYTLTVTDNCSSVTCSQTISQPGTLSLGTCTKTDVSCFGGSNGTATAGAVSNAVGSVIYTWKNSSNSVVGTGPTAPALPAGTYTLSVSDDCSLLTCTVTVDQPMQLSMTATPGTIACNGGLTCVTVNASGGTSPYTGTGNLCFYGPGTHTFTVTDNKNCTVSSTISITQPTAITGNTTTTPATCDLLNGIASVTAGGGTPGYSYAWSPGGQTSQTATGLDDGTYTVTITDNNNCTGTATAVVAALGIVPATPGPITGPAGACRNQTGVVYSISSVVGATSYIWTLPSGASGSSTSTSITVNFSNSYNGGSICVTAISFCGSNASSCLLVPRLTSAPSQPGAMTGPLSLCPLTSATYSVAPVSRATSYEWQVNNGLAIVSGQGSPSVVISAPAGFVSGRIRVRGVNCQGNSSWRTIYPTGVPTTPIWKTAPPTRACGGSCYYFNIDNVQDALSWTVTAPPGCVISSPGVIGSGNPFTSTVSYFRICFPLGFITGNITIVSTNTCGNSAALVYPIRSIPVQPSPITGSTSVCKSQSNGLYTMPSVPNATSYNWTINGGGIVRSGQGTTSVRIRFTSVTTSPVTLSVTAINSCGVSVARTLSINVNLLCKTSGEEISFTNEASGFFESLTAFPNPTTGKATISFVTLQKIDCMIRVSDMTGRIISSNKISCDEGLNTREIDLENYAKGIYLVSVQSTNGEVKTLRLFIE
jgi:hypothetical protein